MGHHTIFFLIASASNEDSDEFVYTHSFNQSLRTSHTKYLSRKMLKSNVRPLAPLDEEARTFEGSFCACKISGWGIGKQFLVNLYID